MSKQKSRTFRLSFIRRRIITLCRIRALRAALLAELQGGPDAALVVEMVERAWLPTRPPTQMVADPPTQSANPQRHVRPVVTDPPTHIEAPPQEETTNSNGHSAATAVVILDSDSDSEFSD